MGLAIKFFTSYYGRVGLPGKRTIGITPVVPNGYKGRVDRRLAPSLEQMKLLKACRTENDVRLWRSNYYALIGQKITPADAAALVDGKILLSHETPLMPSHRHMLKDWFAFFDIDAHVKEWGGETEDEIDQRPFPFMKQKPTETPDP